MTPQPDPLDEPLERLNKEVQRRTTVVRIFPNPRPAPQAVARQALEER